MRVVNASVLPSLPSGPANSILVAMAERGGIVASVSIDGETLKNQLNFFLFLHTRISAYIHDGMQNELYLVPFPDIKQHFYQHSLAALVPPIKGDPF